MREGIYVRARVSFYMRVRRRDKESAKSESSDSLKGTCETLTLLQHIPPKGTYYLLSLTTASVH